MITHIVWDWNGTLFDDFDVCVKSINTLLARHGLPMLSDGEYRQVFGFPVRQYYKSIGFDFDKTPFEVLAEEYMSIYQPLSDSCGLRAGAQDTVDRLNRAGYVCVVLSASRLDHLERQISKTGLHGIARLYGTDDIHASGKEHLARRLAADYPNAGFLFVGDTPHDALTAKAINADIVFLSGGHKAAEELEKYGPVLEDICALPQWLDRKK